MDDWNLQPARDLHLSPTESFRSYEREGGLVSYVSQVAWWTVVGNWLRWAHRLEIHGREHLPDAPSFVLVANHASHLDAMILGAALPLKLRERLFPLAAGDVFFETPALAAFSAVVLNALPVWRKNCGAHAIRDLRRRLLDEPSVYILFPEGTRSRNGQMAAFRPGIGMMAAETDVPIIPCHLGGTFAAFPTGRRLPRLSKVTVQIGRPRRFGDVGNRRQGWEQIAATLEDDVRELAAGKAGADSGDVSP